MFRRLIGLSMISLGVFAGQNDCGNTGHQILENLVSKEVGRKIEISTASTVICGSVNIKNELGQIVIGHRSRPGEILIKNTDIAVSGGGSLAIIGNVILGDDLRKTRINITSSSTVVIAGPSTSGSNLILNGATINGGATIIGAFTISGDSSNLVIAEKVTKKEELDLLKSKYSLSKNASIKNYNRQVEASSNSFMNFFSGLVNSKSVRMSNVGTDCGTICDEITDYNFTRPCKLSVSSIYNLSNRHDFDVVYEYDFNADLRIGSSGDRVYLNSSNNLGLTHFKTYGDQSAAKELGRYLDEINQNCRSLDYSIKSRDESIFKIN